MEEPTENLQADLAANDAPELLAEEVMAPNYAPGDEPVEKPDVDPAEELKVRASASIRKIADLFGIDLSKIKGSGKKGFIKKEDIASLLPAEAREPAFLAVCSKEASP